MNKEMRISSYAFHELPPTNFEIRMGEGDNSLTFELYVKRGLGNRLKYWLFCKFFPFKISRWD